MNADLPQPEAPNRARPGDPVVQEIVRRWAAIRNQQPWAESAARLGLVIEGGGMRGVISGGVLVALEELGLTSVFDEIYAESAGAFNACFFLAGQAKYGSSIYLDDLSSLRFANPLRIGRMLDMDYVIDDVMTNSKRLDVARILGSRTKLFIAVTDSRTGTPRLIDVQREELPLLNVLKATGAIVPLYNRPVWLDGVPYVDGGISDPIPVRDAIRAGCTHILVLLTRPDGFISHPYSKLARVAMHGLFRRWPAAFVHAFYEVQYREYNETRRVALGYGETDPGSPAMAVMAPPDGLVDRMTRSRPVLTSALEASARFTRDLLLAATTEPALPPPETRIR